MDSTNGLIALNQTVATQASWISYLNAFQLMMILTAITIPLILFARSAKQPPGAKPVITE
jgi:heme/copper-type cytochrome/quinol oxidase subunit 4